MFNDFRDDIPPLRTPRKVKPKVVTTSKYNIKKLYFDARKVMFQKQYPEAWAAGGYYDNDMPDITTTNGTTRYIEDVINNLGHHAERVNSMGVPMFKNGKPVLDDKGKQKFRRSGGTNGSTDIHCEIKIPSQSLPAGWKIEIKNKDKILKAQTKYAAKMERVGVLHSIVVVGSLDFFWDEFNRILKL